MKNFKLALTAFLFIFGFTNLSGQGWVKNYPSYYASDQLLTAHELPDGYCFITDLGYYKVDQNGDTILTKPFLNLNNYTPLFLDNGFILPTGVVDTSTNTTNGVFSKFDYDGNIVWQKPIIGNYGGVDYGLIVETTDAKLLTVSRIDSSEYSYLLARKLDNDGNIIWSKQLTAPHFYNIHYPYQLIALPDGSFISCGHINHPQTGNLHYFLKFDAYGNVIWERKDYVDDFSNAYIFSSSIVTKDSSIFIVSAGSWVMMKFDFDGNFIWEKEYEFGYGYEVFFKKMLVELPSGNLLLASFNPFGIQDKYTTLKMLDPDGEVIWEKLLNYLGYPSEKINSLSYLSNGQLLLGGNAFPNIGTSNYMLVKADTFGNIYPHYIEGNIFNDQAVDCEYNGGEGPIPDVVVKATGTDNDFYAIANYEGKFLFNIPDGEYDISVSTSQYWESCQPSYPLEVGPQNDTASMVIPVQPTIFCPLLNVDIVTPLVRNCSTGVYVVKYGNLGTTLAENATLQVTLAPELTYLGSNGSLASQNGQLLTFDLGDVETFDCGGFTINYMVECGAAEAGQTLCTEAHAFPDTPCFDDPYNGPIIETNGNCLGDSVHFTIKNTGGDMGLPSQYIVVEDNIILRDTVFQLTENQEVSFEVAAQEGATYHLIANQDPNLPPILGNPSATASVEGCLGNVNPGAFNHFPQDDGEPWLDIDCSQVVSSFDPNDKTAVPTGWKDEHFIDDRTKLDYLVRFQNTGTDTAFKVVILDTLSAFLNPASIRLGASSNPVRMELSGQGVVRFIFENILLPDSTTNEPASHGFVQFHIEQTPSNQPGTVIENAADIYFDFNTPVRTDTAFHTVHEPWVQIVNGSVEKFHEEMDVKISPNPMGDWAMIEVENLLPGENTMTLIDSNGREVMRHQFNQNRLLLLRNGLASGLYFFRIENNGRMIGSGKVVIN